MEADSELPPKIPMNSRPYEVLFALSQLSPSFVLSWHEYYTSGLAYLLRRRREMDETLKNTCRKHEQMMQMMLEMQYANDCFQGTKELKIDCKHHK